MKEKNAIWMIALLIFSIGVGIAVQGPQTLNPFYPLDVPLNLSGQYIYDSTGDVTINDTVDLNDSHLMDVEDELSEASGSAALPLNYSNRTYLKLNGTNAMEGILDLNGTNLTNVGGLNDCGDEEALIGNGSCRPIMNKLHEFLERDNSVGNHNISMNGQDIRNVELLDQCRLCLEQIRVDFPVSEFPPEDPEYRKKTCTDSGSTQEGWATLTSDSGSGSHDAFWRFKFQCGPRDTEEEEIDTSGCETDYSVLIAGKENDYIDWEDERPVYDLTDSTFTAVVYNGETAADITVETDTGYSETIFMEASGSDGASKAEFVIDPYDDVEPAEAVAKVDACPAANYTYGDDTGEIIECTGYFDDDGDGAYGSDLETKNCSLADVQGSPGNDCNDEDLDVQDNCDSGGNSAPTADYNYNPLDPLVDETIDFDAAPSDDSDGSINTYRWDWDNDGGFDDTGITASTSYSSSGDYPVTLEVEDDDGATDTTTQTVTVGSGCSADGDCGTASDGDSGQDFFQAAACTEPVCDSSNSCTTNTFSDMCGGTDNNGDGIGDTLTEYYVDSTDNTACTTTTNSCRTDSEDTDGTSIAYGTKGTCISYQGCGSGECKKSESTDYCEDSTTLSEFDAHDGVCGQIVVNCESCSNGEGTNCDDVLPTWRGGSSGGGGGGGGCQKLVDDGQSCLE